MIFLQVNRKVQLVCNLNCLVKTEGHLKVTGSVEVVTSRKQYKMETLLLTTNRK